MANARRRRTALSAWQAIKLGVRFLAVWLFLYTLIAVLVSFTVLDALEAAARWHRIAVVTTMVFLALYLALLDEQGEARKIRMQNAKRIRAAGRGTGP